MKKMQRAVQKGFTLIELMIVVAIIGILAAIAIPQYQDFINKSAFKDIVSQVAPYKVAMEMCAQELSGQIANGAALTPCTAAGYNPTSRLADIPADLAAGDGSGELATLTAAAGVITATTVAGAFGQAGATTYIITGTKSTGGNSVLWAVTGTCIAAGLCDAEIN